MPDLYSEVACSSCGRPHTFRDDGPVRRPRGSRYTFICPTTRQPGTFQSTRPEPVILCPAGTVPATWVPE
jgi:hypothetical protein